jgi:hypothetical protein
MDPITEPTPTPVPPAPVRARRGVDLIAVLLGLAVVIAVGGVSFAVGRISAPQTGSSAGLGAGNGGNGGQGPGGSGGQFPGRGSGGLGGFLAGGLTVRGTVVGLAADHITLRLASGTAVDIPLDSQTTYHRQTAATAADVTSGVTVLVQLESTGGTGVGPIRPNASSSPSNAASGALGRLTGPARDITIVAQ